MISLTIGDMNKMSRQDADALRAIANVYHPINRNDNMDVGTLREAIQRGQPGALSTLAELNDAARAKVPTSLVPAAATDTIKVANLASVGGQVGTLVTSGTITKSKPALGEAFLASVSGTAARTGAVATERIAPEDNPATGAPDQHALADQVFGGGVASLTSGNAGGTQVSSITIRPIPAPSTEPDPAAVFSGGGITIDATGIHGIPGLTMTPTEQSITVPADSPMGQDLTAFKAALEQRDPAVVFSGGGLQQAVASLGAAISGGIAATLAPAAGQAESRALEQPAPNVHAAIPTPPPLPAVTPQTSQQQSNAVPSASPPPPPPPAPAPVDASAAALTTNPAPSVELDSAGLPWDSRIHASTKAKIANGTWKKRRGVDEAEVTQVEAQLRAAMAVPPAPASPNAWPFPTDSSSVTGQQAEPAPTFPVLMAFITARVGDKRLTQEQVTAAVQSAGLESLNLVMARPDLIPQIMDELKKVAP